MKPSIEERDGAVFLRVRVQPKSSRNSHSVDSQGRLKVALTAPPVDGAANSALCAYLARALHVPKRTVALAQGEKSRDKLIRIEGIPYSRAQSLFDVDHGHAAKPHRKESS